MRNMPKMASRHLGHLARAKGFWAVATPVLFCINGCGAPGVTAPSEPTVRVWVTNTDSGKMAKEVSEKVYQGLNESAQDTLNQVSRGTYIGGSLLISLPPDNEIVDDNAVKFDNPIAGKRALESQQRSLSLFKGMVAGILKSDIDTLLNGLKKAEYFDRVEVHQGHAYRDYAANNDFRYIVRYETQSVVLFDTKTGSSQALDLRTSIPKRIAQLGETIAAWDRESSGHTNDKEAKDSQIVAITESMQYDEATKRGWVSIVGAGLDARRRALRKIAEICATKNKLLVSDDLDPKGAFKVLDEELKDGVLKISFEALY